MIKDGSLVFVIQNSAAIKFNFADSIDALMGLFHFNIEFEKTIINPLLKIEYKKTATKHALLPTIAQSNEKCYIAVSNDWLTLDKLDCFEMDSNLNFEIKFLIN